MSEIIKIFKYFKNKQKQLPYEMEIMLHSEKFFSMCRLCTISERKDYDTFTFLRKFLKKYTFQRVNKHS